VTVKHLTAPVNQIDLHCELSSVFFMLNVLCVNLSVSTSVCFSSFLFISNDQLYWLLPPSALTSNDQLYWLLPPSALTIEYYINHTERATPSGRYGVTLRAHTGFIFSIEGLCNKFKSSTRRMYINIYMYINWGHLERIYKKS